MNVKSEQGRVSDVGRARRNGSARARGSNPTTAARFTWTDDNPLPRYHQIANTIRNRIDLQELSAGERLPSETALAKSFQVSHLTVRQALSLLEQEGRVERQQGRGTFVADYHDESHRVRLTAQYQNVAAVIAGAKVRLLDTQRVRGPRETLERLGVPLGGEAVRIRRLRVTGKRPLAYEATHLPLSLELDYTQHDMTDPQLIEIIEERAGIFFSEASETIEASLADPETASLLRVAVGSPVLLVRRIYGLRTGGVGCVTVTRYPSHLFRFEVQLVRHGPNQSEWEALSRDWL